MAWCFAITPTWMKHLLYMLLIEDTEMNKTQLLWKNCLPNSGSKKNSFSSLPITVLCNLKQNFATLSFLTCKIRIKCSSPNWWSLPTNIKTKLSGLNVKEGRSQQPKKMWQRLMARTARIEAELQRI